MSEEMPGRHVPWERLTGSLTNLVSALKREGLPAPAVKAITLALLGYIDGQVGCAVKEWSAVPPAMLLHVCVAVCAVCVAYPVHPCPHVATPTRQPSASLGIAAICKSIG